MQQNLGTTSLCASYHTYPVSLYNESNEVAQLEITDAWNSGFPAMAQNPLTLLLVPLLLVQVCQVSGPQVQKCLISLS